VLLDVGQERVLPRALVQLKKREQPEDWLANDGERTSATDV
jgi:hypothetical protein